MPYPDEELGPDEWVVVHKHPHWKMLVVPTLVFLVIVAGCAYAAAILAGQTWRAYGWLALGGLGALGVVCFTLAPLLRWRTTHFVLTNRRVLVREGILARHGMDIPLHRINSVQFSNTLLERILGCGTLSIESASDEALEFDDIPHIQRVHSLLHHHVHPDESDWVRRS